MSYQRCARVVQLLHGSYLDTIVSSMRSNSITVASSSGARERRVLVATWRRAEVGGV